PAHMKTLVIRSVTLHNVATAIVDAIFNLRTPATTCRAPLRAMGPFVASIQGASLDDPTHRRGSHLNVFFTRPQVELCMPTTQGGAVMVVVRDSVQTQCEAIPLEAQKRGQSSTQLRPSIPPQS